MNPMGMAGWLVSLLEKSALTLRCCLREARRLKEAESLVILGTFITGMFRKKHLDIQSYPLTQGVWGCLMYDFCAPIPPKSMCFDV